MTTDLFAPAFHHAMKYEVGNFWNPSDPDVIAGRFETRDQRRKVGYVNIPQDRGGETKYGIAQKANPEINVRALNLEQAMEIYRRKYWIAGSCQLLSYPLAIIHFDGCVNHGVGRANRFLQRSVGVVEDGAIGPRTISAINSANQGAVVQSISNIRTNFYQQIVNRDPSQKMFLNGWMRRINEVTTYSLSKL